MKELFHTTTHLPTVLPHIKEPFDFLQFNTAFNDCFNLESATVIQLIGDKFIYFSPKYVLFPVLKLASPKICCPFIQ